MLKKENAPTRQQRIKGFHRAKMELLAKLRADPFLDGGDYRMLDALLEKFLNDDTHECMPSDAKLAEACACHERTIRRRTKKLQWDYLIKVKTLATSRYTFPGLADAYIKYRPANSGIYTGQVAYIDWPPVGRTGTLLTQEPITYVIEPVRESSPLPCNSKASVSLPAVGDKSPPPPEGYQGDKGSSDHPAYPDMEAAMNERQAFVPPSQEERDRQIADLEKVRAALRETSDAMMKPLRRAAR